MTLAPLMTVGPAIQIHAVPAMAAFALGIVQFAAPKGTIPTVIPGRAEGANRNPEHRDFLLFWIPGPPLRGVPE